MLLCSLILGGIGFILPRYFIWFLSGLLILIGLALAFQVNGKIPAVRNTVDAATKAPSEIAKERASGYAAELFSATWAGPEYELDAWNAGFVDPKVSDDGDAWEVDGIFQINRFRSTQVTVTVDKKSYEKKSLVLQKGLKTAISDLAHGRMLNDPDLVGRGPNEKPGGRFP